MSDLSKQSIDAWMASVERANPAQDAVSEDPIHQAWLEHCRAEGWNPNLYDNEHIFRAGYHRNLHLPGDIRTAEQAARFFHDTYEHLAPSFGYETRTETRQFDPTSPNGKLMIAVCGEILSRLAPGGTGSGEALDREEVRRLVKLGQAAVALAIESGQDLAILDELEAKTTDAIMASARTADAEEKPSTPIDRAREALVAPPSYLMKSDGTPFNSWGRVSGNVEHLDQLIKAAVANYEAAGMLIAKGWLADWDIIKDAIATAVNVLAASPSPPPPAGEEK